MRGKDIFTSLTLLEIMALTACAAGPIMTPVVPGEKSSNNPTNTLTVPPPETTPPPPPPKPAYISPTEAITLLTPEKRTAAMEATAESVATKGPEGLIAEGFPKEAIDSQRELTTRVKFKFTIDGQEHEIYRAYSMDVTLINLDGTPYSDYILALGPGHGFDGPHHNSIVKPEIHNEYGPSEITFSETTTTDIDIEGVILNQKDYGIVYEYKTKDGYKDYAFMLIPKTAVSSSDVLAKMEKDSFPVKHIMLNPGNTNANLSYFGWCTPEETNFSPVVANGAQYTYNSENLEWLGPYLTGGGCSGSGIFVKTPDGNIYYKGIHSGTISYAKDSNTLVAIYPMSDMGDAGFWEAVKRAKQNLDSKGQ
jgi:hypothetical protein